MNRRTRLPLAAVGLFLLIGCQGDAISPIEGPMFAVSDGAHGGLASFFFLPPLFKMPAVHPGTFNPDLQPSVEICDLGVRPTVTPPPPRDCVTGVDPVAEFPAGSVTVSVTDEQYHVNWHTDQSNLLLDHDYRIRVLVSGVELGFADVDPVSNMGQLKNVQTNEYIGLVDGRTLPIKFRIEDAALCGGTTRPCSAGTIDLATGGNVELVLEDADGNIKEVFEVTVEGGTTAEFGGEQVTDVTINIEECTDGGIDLDLRRFGSCLQLTTFFTETGEGGRELELSNPEFEFPLVISTCRLEGGHELEGLSEAEEALITLHQQDGLTVRALSHVSPNCDVITRLKAAPSSFAQRGLRQLGDLAARLFLPQTLHAGSRSAVINLGAGGGTRILGTDCTTAPTPTSRGMLFSECATDPASAPNLVAAAVLATAKTTSKFQFFQPAIMKGVDGTTGQTAFVDQAVAQPPTVFAEDAQGLETPVPVTQAFMTFKVISGGGNFGMNGATPITEVRVPITDGVAAAPTWILGSEPGLNVVRASGKGIATRPGDSKPFVPDIHGVNTSVELPTPTDAHFVEFTATGLARMGSLAFIQQPTNTVSGEAISPPLRIQVFDPSGAPLTEIVRVTVGNDPSNPPECLVLQTSELAIEGVATFANVRVNGTCTGARVAATAGGGEFEFPDIFSEPFDITPAPVTGLLLRYQFDGNLNNSGLLSGYTGTATSVTYPEGRFGSAIKFDATAATGAQFPGTAAVFARGSQWTISLWFMEDAPAKAQSLLWEFRAAEGVDSYHGVASSGGDQVITTCSDGGCFSFPNPTLGVWHNVIYRYDGPSTTVGAPVDIYVDGELVGTITNAAATPIIGSQVKDIRMGSEGAGAVAGPSRFYIDEYRVYNQVFTQAQQCTVIIGGTWTGENCVMP